MMFLLHGKLSDQFLHFPPSPLPLPLTSTVSFWGKTKYPHQILRKEGPGPSKRTRGFYPLDLRLL